VVLPDHHSDGVRVMFVPWLRDEDAPGRIERYTTLGDRHTGFLENAANVFDAVCLANHLDLLFQRIAGFFESRSSYDIGEW